MAFVDYPGNSEKTEQTKTLSRLFSANVGDNKLQTQYFYHMTHIDNLASVLQHGILSHCHIRNRRDINAIDISNADVQKWRSRRESVYQRSIHEYAPLYINPKNPMLCVLRAIQHKLVILKVSREILEHNQHLYTDGNAASRDTLFSTNSEIMRDSIGVLNAPTWSNYDDGKRRRCAELLIYPRVMPNYIVGLVCSNRTLANEVVAITRLPVEVDSSLFF